MNSVTLHGRVGNVSERRKVGDTDVINFSVADARKTKDDFATTWWSVSAWGFDVEKAEKLEKGQNVTVFGRLEELRQYETNGEQRAEIRMRATSLYPGQKSEKKGRPDF